MILRDIMAALFFAVVAVSVGASGSVAQIQAEIQVEPAPVSAQDNEYVALYEALALRETIEIMQVEGHDFGAQIGKDFLNGQGGSAWAAIVSRIYDGDKMHAAVLRHLESGLTEDDLHILVPFFTSDIGQRIISHEIKARRAFVDKAIEGAARAAFRAADGANSSDVSARTRTQIRLIRDYVTINDLVEFNVAGGLNSNLRFYRGLVDGGAYEMTEEDMLSEVWGQEAETRIDTQEWLMSYLLMAYGPLNDGDIGAYIALSKTSAGKALNRALFAGFDAMYGDLSYAIGLAVAAQSKGEDL